MRDEALLAMVPPMETITTLGFAEAKVATAVNGDFVPAGARAQRALGDGDRVEVLAPMQGG